MEKTLKSINYAEFKELNKNGDYCFEINDTRLTDDAEEYCLSKQETFNISDYDKILTESECIKVYEKKKFTLTGKFIFEDISDYLEDLYGYDSYELGSLEDIVGSDIFDKACEEFNKHFRDTFYIAGKEQDFCLNLRDELQKFLKEGCI